VDHSQVEGLCHLTRAEGCGRAPALTSPELRPASERKESVEPLYVFSSHVSPLSPFVGGGFNEEVLGLRFAALSAGCEGLGLRCEALGVRCEV